MPPPTLPFINLNFFGVQHCSPVKIYGYVMSSITQALLQQQQIFLCLPRHYGATAITYLGCLFAGHKVEYSI